MDASLSVTPLFDRILCRRDPPATQSGAILLPQGTRESLERRSLAGNPSTVIAVGEGGARDRMVNGRWVTRTRFPTLKPGDRVMLGFMAGIGLPRDYDPNLCFVFEEDIIAKLEE